MIDFKMAVIKFTIVRIRIYLAIESTWPSNEWKKLDKIWEIWPEITLDWSKFPKIK